jgi:hypothetical protein
MKPLTTEQAIAEAVRKARRAEGYPYRHMPTGYLPKHTAIGLGEMERRRAAAVDGSARLLARINALRSPQ